MTKSAAEYRFGLADKKLAARIGITTRSGDSPKTFQDTILAPRQLANLGIMKSPGTGSMILSMYYPIFEGRRCIGYVGAASSPAT